MKKLMTIIFLAITIVGYSQDENWSGVTVGGYEDIAIISMGEDTIWEKPNNCIDTFTTVTIGSQIWMRYNLHITDGDPGVYSYADNSSNSNTYGFLYTWPAAMRIDTSICGWHLPTDDEFGTLVSYLSSSAGGKMKETGTNHWNSPNTGATNSSGFTALPGGRKLSGGYYDINRIGGFWTSTEADSNSAWYRGLLYNYSIVDRGSYGKDNAYSVRLIKD